MFKTSQIILRPITLNDKLEIFNYRSDKETNKYQSWIPETMDDVENYINKTEKEFNKPNTWFQFVIVKKSNNKIIGDLGVHFIDDYQCELGCTITKDYHKKGFATESLNLVIDYLFNTLNKHRIITSIDPENISSIRLVERLGFRKEAHFKQSLLIDGKWIDDIVYALLKEDRN